MAADTTSSALAANRPVSFNCTILIYLISTRVDWSDIIRPVLVFSDLGFQQLSGNCASTRVTFRRFTGATPFT